MRVAKFKVERYRSIQKSESIDLTTLSVLVGPNNEGKSNILRAIVVGLRALEQIGRESSMAYIRSGSLRRRISDFQNYDWTRDFPLALQDQTPGANSVFEYEFELSEADLNEFKVSTGHILNGHLKIRILIDRDGDTTFKVVKRGPGSPGLNANIRKISEFISRRIRVEYIPTSRTAEESLSIVRSEVGKVLRNLSRSPAFQTALETIDELTSVALQPVEHKLLQSVQTLVPNVEEISIKANFGLDRIHPERVDVLMDDGTNTSLTTKGDGIQSLAAIAWLRMSATEGSKATCIFAVEEPEAHLHPGAVHDLAAALDDLAKENQVILTTHSPILVRREPPQANIIVRSHSAAPAKTLSSVRECLGVELPDNMSSAEVVLIVEGVHDASILRTLLKSQSSTLESALANGRLAIREAGGAQNVPHYFRLTSDSICRVHAILDDDKEGRSARNKLEEMGIPPKDITMLSISNMNESELEDLFNEEVYSDFLLSNFNVSCRSSNSHPQKRFSHRMKDYFKSSGQVWNDSAASNLKAELARILGNPEQSVNPRSECDPLLAAITSALEEKLSLHSSRSPAGIFGQ